jgi:hypothetical protein
MSTRLATALREAAETVPPYDVLEPAVASGHRRRRRSRLLTSLAVALVVALTGFSLAPLLGSLRPSPTGEPQPGAGPALPDPIGLPALFPTGVSASPPGPASVIFSERPGPLTGGRIVTVGAFDDRYRVIRATAPDAGHNALLAPGGGQVAYADGHQLMVVNLRTGDGRRIPSPEPEADVVRPAAWLPDGHGLVVLTITYADDPTREGIWKRLGVLDLDTGSYHGFAAGTYPIAADGFAVAVSVDGGQIAYQFRDFITVYDRSTAAKKTFTLPDTRTVLAGKGAWTPDGRSLAVLHRDTDDYPARRWELRFLDPSTGLERDPGHRPSLAGQSLMRLTGWNGVTGNPVVIGYDGDWTADGELGYGNNFALTDLTRRVGVYELQPGGARTLLRPAAGITGLDVADVVLAEGRTRVGHPPARPGAATWIAIGLAVALAASLIVRRVRSVRIRTGRSVRVDLGETASRA